MPIVAADLDYRHSGGSGNSSSAADLGGAISNTDLTDNTAENLFDHVSGTESAAGDVEYRCFYVRNSHGSLTAQSAKIWMQSNTTSTGDTIDLAVGTAAINGTEQTIADESTAPTGVSWVTNATDYASGVALGSIPNGQHKAVWARRTVNAAAGAKTDNVATFRVGADTAE